MRWRDALRFLRPARLEIGRGPQHMESGRADSRSFPQLSLMSKKVRAAKIKLKRAYEAPAASDGTRILVDRLWPRGVKKADAAIEEWMKEVAEQRIAKMVRPRSGALAGIPAPVS